MTPEEALGIKQQATEETLQSIDGTLKRIEKLISYATNPVSLTIDTGAVAKAVQKGRMRGRTKICPDCNRINFLIEVSKGENPPLVSQISIDFESVSMTEDVIKNMQAIPNFDYVNDILRGRILLDFLEKTNQKALIKDATNMDALMSSQYAKLFRVKS